MKNQISEKIESEIYFNLNLCKGDMEFKSLLSNFVEEQINNQFGVEAQTTALYYSKSLILVLELVKNHTIGKSDKDDKGQTIFSWKSYCKVIQEINDLDDSQKYIYKGHTRKLLSELYKYVINNTKISNEYIDQLIENRWLLEIEEKQTSARRTVEWPSFVNHQIHTNFPLNSSPNELYLYEYIAPNSMKDDKFIKTVIYFKKTNNFIRKLLIEFIESLPKEKGRTIKPSKIHYRQFFYYFGSSLYPDTKHESLKDFSFNTFRRQYRFYKLVEDKFPLVAKDDSSKPHHSLLNILREFYIFLFQKVDQNNSEHNLFQGTGITGRILMSNSFNTYYERGYIFVNRTGFEKRPNRNRWAVISTGNYATSTKHLIHGYDFTEIKDRKYVDDLKNFIWYEPKISGKHLKDEYMYIRDFLNYKYDYELRNKNVVRLGNNSNIISEELMLFYRTHIINKYNNKESPIGQAFSSIKKFIKFLANIYEISPSILNYLELRYRGKKKYGGNPIPQKEFKLVKQGIRDLKNNLLEELYSIVFNLKATTHLREGEILNLKRNCIHSINQEMGTGEIKFFSKLSKEKLEKRTFTIDKIHLINRAIEITSEIAENAINPDKEYIFIKKLSTFQNVITGKYFVTKITGEELNQAFRNIQDSQGLKDSNYSVNNLRHTFKDTVWREGIEAGLSTMVLEYMTNTTFETDVKRYRAKSNAQRYAEIFAGITISDVTIDGTITQDDSMVDALNPVEEGLGACKYSSCQKVNKLGEEEKKRMYRCLTCNSFITSLSRKNAFKNKIEELKIKRIEARGELEKNFYEDEIKLYTAYFSGLLELKDN